MDFSNISLREAAEVATPVHLELDGKPLYMQADKTIGAKSSANPCRVLIRGVGSDAVSEAVRKVERLEMAYQQRAQRTKDKDLDPLIERHQDAMREAMADLIRVSVSGFEGIVYDGKEVEATPEYIARLCGPRTAFFQQVYDAILERRSFLTSAAAG